MPSKIYPCPRAARRSATNALSADPGAPQWRAIDAFAIDHGPRGEPTPENRFAVRSRWTDSSLYFLFVCSELTGNLPVQQRWTNLEFYLADSIFP